jgi:hypothetical protein
VDGPAVQTDVAKTATRDAVDTTTRNQARATTVAAPNLREDVVTMTETRLESNPVVAEAGGAHPLEKDRLVEASRARRS